MKQSPKYMLKKNLFLTETDIIYRIPATGHPRLTGFLSRGYRVFLVMAFFMAFFIRLHGQTPSSPPNRLQVYLVQDLSFGSFFTGSSGGAVVITPEGNRTVSGTVIALPNSPGTPAIFEVRLIPNRMVHISFPSSATFCRVGGRETMTVTGFTSDKPGNSFVTGSGQSFINTVRVGATLNAGNTADHPPGNYTGSFTVTFIEE
jgi:hypothetical protein